MSRTIIAVFTITLLFSSSLIQAAVKAEFFLKAPNILRASEKDLQRYSAILAATEPFRRERDATIEKSMGKMKRLSLFIKGKSPIDHALANRNSDDIVDSACATYESCMEAALMSYGMRIPLFNAISEKLCETPQLKNKILHQASFYKVAADLDHNLKPQLPFLPSVDRMSRVSGTTSKLTQFKGHQSKQKEEDGQNQLRNSGNSKSTVTIRGVLTSPVRWLFGSYTPSLFSGETTDEQQRKEEQDGLLLYPTFSSSSSSSSASRAGRGVFRTLFGGGTRHTAATVAAPKKVAKPPSAYEIELRKFSMAAKRIENERLALRESLKSALHIQHIPEGVSDKTMQSAYNPVIQRAVREFPIRAAYIINEHGLDVEEFEKLQKRANRNILYRYRVQKMLKALALEKQQHEEAAAAAVVKGKERERSVSSQSNNKSSGKWWGLL